MIKIEMDVKSRKFVKHSLVKLKTTLTIPNVVHNVWLRSVM